MKHIKLFENWAEEIEVPEYLDPAKKFLMKKIKHPTVSDSYMSKSYTVFSTLVKNALKGSISGLGNSDCNYCTEASPKLRVNFRSFHELNHLWRKDGYDELCFGQHDTIYKLQNFDGLPEVRKRLILEGTEIKSLKGLENRNFTQFKISYSNVENLKYCPESTNYSFGPNPLLSYLGIRNNNIQSSWFDFNLCGSESYTETKTLTTNQITDIEFHAEQFCNFKDKIKSIWKSNYKQFNPWHQCYYDPNDVENFEFLFLPFWNNSENFRDKAQTVIPDIDLGKLNKGELW